MFKKTKKFEPPLSIGACTTILQIAFIVTVTILIIMNFYVRFILR